MLGPSKFMAPINKTFAALLLVITLLGLGLRLVRYDSVPPFTETADEFIYPWYGMSLLKEGVPTSWSNFAAYEEFEEVEIWGQYYRLVTPYLDKPPLYPLITGGAALMTGASAFSDVRLAVLRLIPIALSVVTIFLTGLVGRRYFDRNTGLLAAALYATIPTVVLSNRLSVAENLLTPLVLAGLFLLAGRLKTELSRAALILLGLLSGLAVLTKQTGLALAAVFCCFFLSRRQWKRALFMALAALASLEIYFAFAAYYDWQLFASVVREFSGYHTAGAPEIAYAIFRLPLVGHGGGLFFDGAVLAGYILLFASPFWLLNEHKKGLSYLQTSLLLGFPFIYTIVLGLMESGHKSAYFFGWHLYPLFPFLTLLLAKAMLDLWQRPDILKAAFLYLVLGSSTVSFLLFLFPRFQDWWQFILTVMFAAAAVFFLSPRPKDRRALLTVSFIIFMAVNITTVLFAFHLYPSGPQPL